MVNTTARELTSLENLDYWLGQLFAGCHDEILDWVTANYPSIALGTEKVINETFKAGCNHHQNLRRQRKTQAKQAAESGEIAEACEERPPDDAEFLATVDLFERYSVPLHEVLSGVPLQTMASEDFMVRPLALRGKQALLSLISNPDTREAKIYSETSAALEKIITSTFPWCCKHGHLETVKCLWQVAQDLSVSIDLSEALLSACSAKENVDIRPTIEFLVFDLGQAMSSACFSKALSGAEVPTCTWLLDTFPSYVSQEAYQSAVKSANEACWKVGQYWAHYFYDSMGFESNGDKKLCQRALEMQDLLRRMEAQLEVEPSWPMSDDPDACGRDHDGCGGGDWTYLGYTQALKTAKRPIPSEFLAAVEQVKHRNDSILTKAANMLLNVVS